MGNFFGNSLFIIDFRRETNRKKPIFCDRNEVFSIQKFEKVPYLVVKRKSKLGTSILTRPRSGLSNFFRTTSNLCQCLATSLQSQN